MRLFLAIKCLFRVLFDADFAEGVRRLTRDGETPAAVPGPSAPEKAAPPRPMAPVRSDAISLLAALQRDARFVDIVSESLEGYSDAQIGAAARDVLADCGKVLKRFFALQPVVDAAEGEALQVAADYDTGRFRLTGNVSQQLPAGGTVLHGGWEATQCELPAWTGSESAARVVAPAEVELS